MRQRIRFCTSTDGVRVAYATAGRGSPLLRAGGWLTHVEHDWESPVWRHWLRELTAHHTLARFDIRGSGLSDRDPREMGLDAWLRDMEAVVDALGWERFPILGLCQGSAVALAYAVRHPDRVSRLVLYNGYVQGAHTRGAARAQAERAEALGRMIEVGWGSSTPAFRRVFTHLLMPDASPRQLSWWDSLQRSTAPPESARRLWSAFHRIDVRGLAPQVRAPTLVCHVRRDGMVPFEQGRQLASLIPDASFVPLESNNHILPEDDPAWPVFTSAMRGFLAGDLGAPRTPTGSFDELTARERAVLDAVARGQSNAQIADSLRIAGKTVRNHVSNILGKLGVSSRGEAIVRAREAGFGAE
ncbi:MAG: alpha/beta fold hydrolase [Myxococcota bacterium]